MSDPLHDWTRAHAKALVEKHVAAIINSHPPALNADTARHDALVELQRRAPIDPHNDVGVPVDAFVRTLGRPVGSDERSAIMGAVASEYDSYLNEALQGPNLFVVQLTRETLERALVDVSSQFADRLRSAFALLDSDRPLAGATASAVHADAADPRIGGSAEVIAKVKTLARRIMDESKR